VLVEFREAFLDLRALRPDPVVDERFLVVGEVHQPGEVLAQSHRIDEDERSAPRWMDGEQAQGDGIEREGGITAAVAFDHDRALVGKCQ